MLKMNDKLFYKILTAFCIAGTVSVIALTLLTVYLYKNTSIIDFIARGG